MMQVDLCARHAFLLAEQLELLGLMRPVLLGEPAATFDPLAHARQLIVNHTTHFAGKASLQMLQDRSCPLCFANKNPAGVNLDGWIDHAAQETLEAAIAHRDGEAAQMPLVT